MRNLPETVHAYNIPRLNVLFVLFSLALLATVGWILWDDYYREWKPYQRQAKRFEEVKLQQDRAAAQKKLEESNYTEVTNHVAQAEAALKQRQSEIDQITKKRDKVNGDLLVKANEFNTAKAKLDEKKSKYDESIEFGMAKEDVEKRLEALRESQHEVDSIDLEVQKIRAEKDALDEQIAQFNAEKTKLQKDAQKLGADKTLVEKNIAKLNNERKASPLLDAPLIEFAKPTVQVKQIIAEDQTYSLNFTDVPRIDRCITCHTFADKKDTLPEGEEGFRYSTLPLPWASHSRLDLFLDPNSPHPVEKFGCSTCHMGWDRGTTFVHSAHIPSFLPVKDDYVKYPLIGDEAHWVPKANIEKWQPGVIAKLDEHQKLVKEREELKGKPGQKEKLEETRAKISALRTELSEKYHLNRSGLAQVQFASMTQEEAWQKPPLNWFHMHHKEDPMRPREFVESSCIKCHQGVTEVPVRRAPGTAQTADLDPGEKVNMGLRLIEQAGCFACHKMAALETTIKYTVRSNDTLSGIAHSKVSDPQAILAANGLASEKDVKEGRELNIPVRVPFSKPGPSLLKIASKTNKEWMLKWLDNPKAFRPNTFMPRFWNNDNNRPGMKYEAVQAGKDGKPVQFDWADRNAVEMRAIAEFVFGKSAKDQSGKYLAYPPPPAGDAANGEKIVNSVGCMGCHVVDQKLTDISFRDRKFRSQGPMLFGAGSKYDAGWLFAWLKDPKQYRHNTRMPNLRLSDKEAADITAFLLNSHNQDFEKKALPEIKADVLRDTALDYLRGTMPMKDALAEVDSKYASDDAKFQFLGAKLVERYGCMDCHDIQGYENAKPISIELSDWASKLPTKLDFGFIEIPHNNMNFLHQKLQAPRSLDRVATKKPQEMMRMPQYDFTEEQIQLIMTAVLGMTNEKAGKAKRNLNESEWLVENGRFLIKEMNCMGCHINEGQGGAIRRTMDEDTQSFLFPPSLEGVGTKVRPEWLHAFIKNPGDMKYRYWMQIRMPTYNFTDDQLNTLTQYFALRDKVPYPFEEDVIQASRTQVSPESIAAGARIVEKGGCLGCHAVRSIEQIMEAQNPATPLGRVRERMRPKGLIAWLNNPGTVSLPHPVTPGVKMPSFWTEGQPSPLADILGGDNEKQIQAVADYLFHGNISNSVPAAQPQAAPAPAAPQQAK